MKNKLIISALCAAAVCTFIISGCMTGLPSVKRNFKKRHGIILPDDTRLEYIARTSTGLRGESAEYFVFAFDETPEFLASFKSRNLSEDENAESYLDAIKGYFLNTIEIINGVSPEYIPDFNAVYEWTFGESAGGLCAIYYPDVDRMFACYNAISNQSV